MEKLLIASHNSHKIKEFKEMLKVFQLEIVTLKDLNDTEEVIEDSDTFYGNAFKKADFFSQKYRMLTLADDSGLTVEALNGMPGIYSARYSGFGDLENTQKVLDNMRNIEHRKAAFIAVLVLVEPSGRVHHVEGKIEGIITKKPMGNQGFGYDPIFYVPHLKKTLAEVDATLKNSISHRGLALTALKEKLYEIINHQ
jgi:non-canonical purine NTP pyrophosphatase (RdgB/HAM1 family)